MAKDKYGLTRILVFTVSLLGLFFFASQTMAAQSSASVQRQVTHLTFNAGTVTKAGPLASNSGARGTKKAEILAKALRVPLGSDFKAFFTVEPPRGIEAVREELESKTVYRAVFGINIPL